MTNTYKPNMRIDTYDKDAQLTTNPCSSDRNCINKGALGKFFRKQDFGKIERKKKVDQQTSLMCYLTPKNCEDSTKIIKQKFRQNTSELNISNFLSQSYTNLGSKQIVNKNMVNMSLYEQPTSRMTSIEKGGKPTDRKDRVSFKQTIKREDKQESLSSREMVSKLRGTGSIRNLKQSEIKREQEQGLMLSTIPSSKSISTIYDKQLKKVKNQCEHYSQLLQTCNKEKQQSANQIKSLSNLVQELKQRNANLSNSQEDFEKEILQLNSQLEEITNENKQLKQEINNINDQNIKYQQEICYLKSSINDLNERIDIMLQSASQTTPKKNLSTSIAFSNKKQFPHNTKRINSMCFVNKSQDQNTQQDLKLIIHQLQQQLKYSQVEVNMLKRVKMDINKKNQQFIKLQRQNQILKNQIFDMKMSDVIEEQGLKPIKNVKSHNANKSGFAPSGRNRNNFQISLQRGNRAKDYGGNKGKDFDIKSQSSDTLSLNLSLSPEKEKFRS